MTRKNLIRKIIQNGLTFQARLQILRDNSVEVLDDSALVIAKQINISEATQDELLIFLSSVEIAYAIVQRIIEKDCVTEKQADAAIEQYVFYEYSLPIIIKNIDWNLIPEDKLHQIMKEFWHDDRIIQKITQIEKITQ